MNEAQIREIADAILYEGYLLYPYRHSSIKNRQRWTFGVVYPRDYSEFQGINEPWQMRTECLVAGTAETRLNITLRFLHLLKHTTTQQEAKDEQQDGESGRAGYQSYDTWEEGIAREVDARDISLDEMSRQARRVAISIPAEKLTEPGAETLRVQRAIEGALTISTERVGEGVFKITALIENTSTSGKPRSEKSRPVYRRDELLLHSFVSTHTILRVQQGGFISLLEPPDELADVAKACQNTYTWPVLIGHEGERDTMLSSPIILYDYPQIAPESIGTLFDGTEIDEILTLRIMTLTDEEKQEMRKADERVNALLERTESLTAEDLMSLHGVIRNLQSVDEEEVSR